MDDRPSLPVAANGVAADGIAADGIAADDIAADDIAALVLDAELRLLDPAVRQNRAAVEQLLAPDFREIGQSGRLWSRAEMLDALQTAEMSSTLGGHEVQDARVDALAPDLFLLTYLATSTTGSTRRSSLWRGSGTRLRCVFHQGTRTSS